MSKELVMIILSVIYMGVSVIVGTWFTRRQKSTEEYFLAGKSAGPVVLGIASAAGLTSGWAFIGNPGMGYQIGLGYLTAMAIIPFSAFIPWMLFARKFRILADTHSCMTVPDVISARFNSETLTLLCSIGVLFGLIAYTAAQFMALGYLFGVVFGLRYEVGLLVGVAIIGAYTVSGGQRGILWTNVIQGTLMILAAVGGFFFAWILIGGPGPAYSGMKSIDPKLVTFTGKSPIGWWISYIVVSIMGAAARMAFLPRFFMIKSMNDLKWAPVFSPICGVIMGVLGWSVPFVYLGLQAQGAAPPLVEADECMPTFLMLFTPSILAGVLMAGALAATMSTAAVYMNIGAATLVNDLGMRHLKLRFKNPVAAARWATVLFTIVAVILGLTAGEFVMMMGLAAVGVWASTVGAVLTFGLLWKGTTKEGAIAGASIGLIFSIGIAMLGMYGIYKLPYGIIPGAVGALLSFLTVFIVSLYTQKTPMDEKMDRVVALPLIARGM
ncbi:hypothetical protein ACFLX8_03200 [Chloroflexota bacterium]